MLPAATVQNKKCLAVPNIRYPFPQRDRRVAQAFDLAGITNTVGAQSFAHFAKGGSRDCLLRRGADSSRRRSKRNLRPALIHLRVPHPKRSAFCDVRVGILTWGEQWKSKSPP